MAGNGRKRRARKRLTIELEPEQEQLLRDARAAAAQAGLTLRELVLTVLAEVVSQVREYQEAQRRDP